MVTENKKQIYYECKECNKIWILPAEVLLDEEGKPICNSCGKRLTRRVIKEEGIYLCSKPKKMDYYTVRKIDWEDDC